MKVPNFRFFHVAVVLDHPSCNLVRSLRNHCYDSWRESNWPTISIIHCLPSTLLPLYEKSLVDTASKQHNINIRFKQPFRTRFSTKQKAVGINLALGDLAKLQAEISANLRREVSEEYKKLDIGHGGDVDRFLHRKEFRIQEFRNTQLMGGCRPRITLRSKLSDADADHWLSVLKEKISVPWEDMNLTGIGIFLKETHWRIDMAGGRGEHLPPPLLKYFSFLEHTPRPIIKMRYNDANEDTEIQHNYGPGIPGGPEWTRR